MKSKKAIIFVHIPKTGGTTIRHHIEPLCLTPINKIHFTSKEVISKIGRKDWDDLFKMTCIRDPWSRLKSFYAYRKATIKNTGRKRKNKKFITKDAKGNKINLNEFIGYTYEFYKKGKHPSFPKEHNFKLKLGDMTYALLDDRDELSFDHVIKFPHIEEGLKEILKIKDNFSSIENSKKLSKCLRFTSSARMKRTDYANEDKYTAESIEIISQMMKLEIELFNFVKPEVGDL